MEKYNRKWAITYQGRMLIPIYGKKNAYELQQRLSQHLDGLDVMPFSPEDGGGRKRRREQTILAPQ